MFILKCLFEFYFVIFIINIRVGIIASRYESVGKLSGGHQAAVMCLAVGKMSEEEDIVVTGSKDHYIKVNKFTIL